MEYSKHGQVLDVSVDMSWKKKYMKSLEVMKQVCK